MTLKKVGILTGGGDCSGLNAVIRAVTRAAIIQENCKVIGIEEGFEGLVRNRTQELTIRSTRDILTLGGTILGTTNKGNPFAFREYTPDGGIRVHDYSERALENFRALGLDCLMVVGGEGTMEIAHRLFEMGVPVIGIPKTIDNDLEMTDYTFGFQTAVEVASDAMDRLHTTGRSHRRVMILEVMGRNAGWIALEAGIAGGAHVILIPEIPYRIENIVEKIRLRAEGGSPYSIVMVAEGAHEEGGSAIAQESGAIRLQGVPQLAGWAFISPPRSRSISLSRCAAPCWATSSGAARRAPSTGCWARGSAAARWRRRPGASSATWWPCAPRRSSWCRSRRLPESAARFRSPPS